MAASQRPDERDPFAVLGVPRDCTPEALHRAYRALARRYHPDVNTDAGAAERMRRVNAAFVAARRQLRERTAARISITVSTKPAPPSTPAPSSTPATPTASAPESALREQAAPAAPVSQPREPAPSRAPASPDGHGAEAELGPSATNHRMPSPLSSQPSRLFQSEWASATITRRATFSGAVRRGRWLPWPLWGLLVLLLAALPVIVLLLFAHVGWIGGARHTTPPGVAGFALGRATTIQWPGLGSIVLSERAVAQLPAGAYAEPSWSFDGQYVALITGGLSGQPSQKSIVIFDASGQQVRTFPGFAALWSPHAEQLAILVMPFGASVPQLYLADAADGTDRMLAPHVSVHIAWSPDGAALLFSADSLRGLRLLDLQSMRTTLVYDAPGSDTTHVIALGWFSANAILCLQTNGSTTRLVLVDTSSGRLTPLPPTLTSTKPSIAWNSARGQVLYIDQPSGQSASTPLLLDRASGAIQALSGLRGMTVLAGWSADNQWLAAANTAVAADGSSQSTLCLMSLPTPLPSAAWATRCLPIAGAITGLRWEGGAARLTYLRASGPAQASTRGAELRALTIQPVAAAPTSQASPRTSTLSPEAALLSLACDFPPANVAPLCGDVRQTCPVVRATGHTSCWHSGPARGFWLTCSQPVCR